MSIFYIYIKYDFITYTMHFIYIQHDAPYIDKIRESYYFDKGAEYGKK